MTAKSQCPDVSTDHLAPGGAGAADDTPLVAPILAKLGSVGGAAGRDTNAVEHPGVVMEIGVEGRARPVNGREGAGVSVGDTAQVELALGGPSLPAEDLREEVAKDAGAESRVVGEDEAQRGREGSEPTAAPGRAG